MKYERPPIDPYKNITYGSTKTEEFEFFVYDEEKRYPLLIEKIGITYPDKDYFIARKHPHYFVIEYVEEGRGYINIEGKNYMVEEDCVYILSPGIEHNYGADKDNPYKKIWINCFSDILAEIIASYGLKGVVVFPNSGCKQYFYDLIKVANEKPYNDGYNIEVSRIIFNLILTLSGQMSQKEKMSNIVLRTKQYLDSAVYRKLTVEKLCEELSVSKSQMTREFKKYYNQTPYQYLLNKKIAMAKKLLLMTNMKVQEISDSLCFSDEYNFSNIFKAKVGLSPLSFRKKDKENDG